MNDPTASSATELASAIRSKRMSSRELIDLHLERVAAVNPALNAVIQHRAEAARREADRADAALARGGNFGVLHGVPITIKDTLNMAGLPNTAGTKGRSASVADADASAVARLRAAGAVVIGRTNVPELASAIETDNLIYGRTNNPYDLARTPGGSSGGDAAIVAAGGSPLSLGTDAGGSIRIPAHFCGLAALKPTAGRVPRTGQFPPPLGARNALFHVSLIARRVQDLTLALSVIAGPDHRDHSVVPMTLDSPARVRIADLRIAFFDHDTLAPPIAAVAAAVHDSVKELQAAGAQVREDRPTCAGRAYTVYHDISRGDGGAGVRALLQNVGTNDVSSLLQQSINTLMCPPMDGPAEALAAFLRWDVFRNTMAAYMEHYDAVIAPVAPYVAFAHGESRRADIVAGLGYSQMHNLTGWPAVTVRVGTTEEGLPLGIQIAAKPWREDIALAVASHLEEAFGGWQAPPLLSSVSSGDHSSARFIYQPQ